MSAINSHLLAFEHSVLYAVQAALPERAAALLSKQVEAINKVQRLLDWHEIEFYCMKWFKVSWPEEILFEKRYELRIANVKVRFGSRTTDIAVWSVGGHVFSLEAARGLKELHEAGPGDVLAVELVAAP